MIEAFIESVRVGMRSSLHVVILRERGGKRRLPIFVARPEGDAIHMHLNGEKFPRPMTHDLAASILEHLHVSLKRVVINELRSSYFYAQVVLAADGREVVLDARPSDALALAVRTNSPIYIAPEVLEEASVLPPEFREEEETGLEAFDEFISSLDFDDLERKDKEE